MRKKTMLLLCSIVIAIAAVSSCSFNTYSNGNFDGHWQLTRVDSLSNGKSTDMTDARVFWAVQAKLIQARNYSTGVSFVLFRFAKSDNKLTLSDPHYNVGSLTDSTVQDPVLTDVEDVRLYGVNAIPEEFAIDVLNADEMVLTSKTVRLYFVKF